jgi:hypothetical protein
VLTRSTLLALLLVAGWGCSSPAPSSAVASRSEADAGSAAAPEPDGPRYSDGAYNSLAGAFGRFAGSQLFALVNERMEFYKLRLDGDDPKSPVAIGVVPEYLSGSEQGAVSGEMVALLLSGSKPSATTRSVQVIRLVTTAVPPGPLRLLQRSAPVAFRAPVDARFKINVTDGSIAVQVHTDSGQSVHRFKPYGPMLMQAPPEHGISVGHRRGSRVDGGR